MKAKVAYIASRVPSFLFDTLPVVQKRDVGAGTNFSDKAELVAWVEESGTAQDADTFMSITCQCGEFRAFVTKDDVPASDLTCGCGRKLIMYGTT